MENTSSNKPKKSTDGFECKCKACGKVIYSETIVGILQSDNSYKYTKHISGTFSFDCDSEGNDTGPWIPSCNCAEVTNAKGKQRLSD